jgi:hemerythrin-like domain-containing protein
MSAPSSFCDPARRRCLVAAGATVLTLASAPLLAHAAAGEASKAEDVTAAEDLMREHGVLRRALLVYAEAASRLMRGNSAVQADALAQTARLFRRFGEDYHERSLEEKHVFPTLIKRGGDHAEFARTLIHQHERGRQITAYVLSVTQSGRLGQGDGAPLASALSGMVRMYQHHTAIEDTVVFPAWKKAISSTQYRDLAESFEQLEQRLFGKDGFDDAVRQIAAIESVFGLADLGALTAPAPPQPAVSGTTA